ncbi:hypothetical protein BJ912DRAFT_967480, partial [Pholiota molesta]
MLSPGNTAESPKSPYSRTPTVRRRVTSEIVVDNHSHFNRASSHTISSPEHLQESAEGATITIASNSHYLRRIPQLDQPPAPRHRRKSAPEGSILKSTSSLFDHSKEQDTPRSFATRKYIFAVAHIFEEAEISLPRIKQGVIDAARKAREQNSASDTTHNWRLGTPSSNAAYLNLQRTWELAILAILQIEMAVNDPLLLLYGCVYIIRFGSMRKVSKAASQRSTTSLFPRATVTAVLGLGVIYFVLIMNTLRRYGHVMDRAWHKLATGWIAIRSPGMPSVRWSALHSK